MTQYAVRHGDEIVQDFSWTCVADVIASHGAFAKDHRLPGKLLVRAGDGDRWRSAGLVDLTHYNRRLADATYRRRLPDGCDTCGYSKVACIAGDGCCPKCSHGANT